jgi:hypothetical protein
MNCPYCDRGIVRDPQTGPRPCAACGGCAVLHCCEGEQAAPDPAPTVQQDTGCPFPVCHHNDRP